MKLYQLRGCPFALRTRIVLFEKGLSFETTFIDRANKLAEVLTVSPTGATPVLYDGDVRLYESAVINEYLEEQYPTSALMPSDAAGRARVRLALHELGPVLAAGGAVVRAKLTHAGEDELARARTGLKDALIPWDERLRVSAHVTGDALTLADVTLFAHVRAHASSFEGALPSLSAWVQRVSERPAVQAAMAGAI
jgi:glutathione S-transferase